MENNNKPSLTELKNLECVIMGFFNHKENKFQDWTKEYQQFFEMKMLIF